MNGLNRHKTKVLLVMLGVTVLAACPQSTVKVAVTDMDADRPEAGATFRHRWWNYYIRALDAVDNQDFTAALADLGNALTQRSRDQRMARTYGMHFIDYFPHRERGVVHWLNGNLKEAETELSLSIEQSPSAKARFYLDLVRKRLIQQRGGPIELPQLSVDVPVDTIWSRADRVQIKGRAADPNFVHDILIDGQRLHLEGSQVAVDFIHELSLPQGCHAISVEAVNLVDQKTRLTINICADRLGPTVVLERIERQGSMLLLSGVAMDDAGVAELVIDGQPIHSAGEPETAFSNVMVTLDRHSEIECRDVLGNRTTFRLTPSQMLDSRSGMRIVASMQLAGLFPTSSDSPPIMRLPGWQDHQAVYMDKVVLTGSVSDQERIVSLTINGEPLLPRPCALYIFSHIVDLAPGINAVTLAAEDADGNRSQRRLTIERRIPKGLLLEDRLRLSVFAFEQKGYISPSAFAFQDDFISEIVQLRRFQVVERQRLDLILQEQKISQTQLIDTGTAVRVGNLAAAQALLIGSLVETRTGIEIFGRVIDTETADILCTVDVYGEVKTLPGLKNLAQALALKLHREFPLVDGMVINKQGNMIITDLTLDKLRAQRRILVYAEHPVVNPQTNLPLGIDHEVLGGARITQADDRLAKARLIIDSNPAIRPRHRVITQ